MLFFSPLIYIYTYACVCRERHRNRLLGVKKQNNLHTTACRYVLNQYISYRKFTSASTASVGGGKERLYSVSMK